MDHYIDRNNFRKVILNYYSYLHSQRKERAKVKGLFSTLRSLSILAICFFKFSLLYLKCEKDELKWKSKQKLILKLISIPFSLLPNYLHATKLEFNYI